LDACPTFTIFWRAEIQRVLVRFFVILRICLLAIFLEVLMDLVEVLLGLFRRLEKRILLAILKFNS